MIIIINYAVFMPLIAAFISAVIVAPLLIPVLHKLKFGQSILEIGPSWHKAKSGTPTMGGVIFIFASLVGILFAYKDIRTETFLLIMASFGFGLVGFIDDYIKVVKKRNLGLRAWQKMALQLIICILFAVISLKTKVITTEILIPFTSFKLDLGILYVPFAVFVMLGTVNSVNLTDGLDGLATTITIIVTVFFAVICNLLASKIFAMSLIGGLLGFLLFNKYPAKVFMGDTGSLFLGGAVSAFALLLSNPIILIIVGFVYMAEALSVIIQVSWFKRTGKRIFKMSPIHHHFEMCGWSEVKIVTVFSLVTLLLCIVGYFAI